MNEIERVIAAKGRVDPDPRMAWYERMVATA
jgi:hypothetical protein